MVARIDGEIRGFANTALGNIEYRERGSGPPLSVEKRNAPSG